MDMSTAHIRGWAPAAAGTLLVALGVFLLLAALGVGAGRRAVTSSADTQTPLAIYEERTPHVLSSVIVTGVQGGVQGAEIPLSQLPPLSAGVFTAPIAAYKAYAVQQVSLAEREIGALRTSLMANDRNGAEEAWRAAYGDYLRLGGVYLTGQLATLNRAIDGTPGGLSGGVDSPEFTGFHRIEYGLWTNAPLQPLLAVATHLESELGALRRTLPGVAITPLEYATRTHEILEDALRDLLSGVDVPWSGEGVVATAAGLGATKELVSTLRPVLKGREGVITLLEAQLPALAATLSSLAASHGGRLPTNAQLSQAQAASLDGAVGAALEALAQVPGALETEAPSPAPKIPAGDLRTDP
jgi:iron uptake system EfeUOB component EfeO/EfeM